MAKKMEPKPRITAELQKMIMTAPWLSLAMMGQLTPKQWRRLLGGDAIQKVEKDILLMAASSLRKYPLDRETYKGDVGHEAMLKLTNGKFMDLHDGKRHPYPYLLGCVFNYCRVEVRSIWRNHRREQGQMEEP
jgi:hypothetical protein